MTTLQQFKYHFRDVVISAAERNGIYLNAVTDGLDELGCDWDAFPPGTGMRMENAHDRDLLPAGSVIMVNEPSAWHDFGMFVLGEDGRWRHVLGGLAYLPDRIPVRVDQVAGEWREVAWLVEPETPDDTLRVAEFKARAWLVASKVQERQQWCGQFTRTLARCGISEACVQVQVTP